MSLAACIECVPTHTFGKGWSCFKCGQPCQPPRLCKEWAERMAEIEGDADPTTGLPTNVDRNETLTRERDAAREHAVEARLREKAAEDARVTAVDRAEALQVITEQQADSIAKLERDVQRWQEAHVLAVKQREEANAYGDEEAERADRAEAALRSIAEGNLGDGPGQANYARIKAVALAALPHGEDEPPPNWAACCSSTDLAACDCVNKQHIRVLFSRSGKRKYQPIGGRL